jgi:hypothetical protein
MEFKSNEFVSADSAGVAGVFFVSTDSKRVSGYVRSPERFSNIEVDFATVRANALPTARA